MHDGFLPVAGGFNFLPFRVELERPAARVLAEVQRGALDKLAASTMGKMRGLLRSPQPREGRTTSVQVKGFGDVYTRELGFTPFPLRPGFSGDLDAKRSGCSFHHGHEKRRQIIA